MPVAIVTVHLVDVRVGDVILFGWDRPTYDGAGGTKFYETDRDAVVTVDADGAHFAGGTYLAYADGRGRDVLVERTYATEETAEMMRRWEAQKRNPPEVKPARWWNAGDSVVRWALADPALQ